MSTEKIDPSKKDLQISSTDDLVKTSKSGDVELSEEELKRVSGGAKVEIKWTTTAPIKVDY
jgi:bacteriocin-like protein